MFINIYLELFTAILSGEANEYWEGFCDLVLAHDVRSADSISLN